MNKEKVKTINQRHPPRPKSRRDVDLNKTCTILKIDGTVSSVAGYGTKNACTVFVQSLRENAKKLNIKLVGNYVILGHKIKDEK